VGLSDCICCEHRSRASSYVPVSFPVPWKWVTLPAPKVEVELREGKRGIELHASTEQVVPFFHAELADLEGHFDGDWAVLRPGAKYVLRWQPHAHRGGARPTLADAKRRLRTFSLYATYEHAPERRR
jgi:hypothetical protein